MQINCEHWALQLLKWWSRNTLGGMTQPRTAWKKSTQNTFFHRTKHNIYFFHLFIYLYICLCIIESVIYVWRFIVARLRFYFATNPCDNWQRKQKAFFLSSYFIAEEWKKKCQNKIEILFEKCKYLFGFHSFATLNFSLLCKKRANVLNWIGDRNCRVKRWQ